MSGTPQYSMQDAGLVSAVSSMGVVQHHRKALSQETTISLIQTDVRCGDTVRMRSLSPT